MVSLFQNIKLKTNKNKISYIFNDKDKDNLRLETIETILKESIFENESKICFKNFLLKTKIDSNGDINFFNENNKDYDITEKIVLNSILKLNLGNDTEEQNILNFKKKLNINDNNEDINIYSKIFNSISLVIHKILHRKSITNEKNVEKCIYYSDFNSKKVFVGVGDDEREAKEKEKSTICPEIYKIIEKNKNFEFFSIKSIVISFVNLVNELVNNYLEVKEKNNIFEIIYNDFLLKCNLCSAELEDIFALNLDNFQKKFKIAFTLSELFTQIFWNFIFHNKTLYNLLIISYLELDTNEINKIYLKKILKILCNVSVPLKYQIIDLLNIYKISEKDDLMSLIVNEKNKHHNEIVKAEIEKSNNKNKNEKENEDEDDEHKDTNKNINMNNNLSKNENGNNYNNNIIIANDISTIRSKKQNEKNEEKEKKEKKEEKEENDDNNEKGIDLEHKTVEEIYNYINEEKEKASKTKKKKRARKNKKNKKEIIEENKNEKEDIIVVKFKEDLKGKLFHAGNFKKIKPKLSEEWIKNISSYI